MYNKAFACGVGHMIMLPHVLWSAFNEQMSMLSLMPHQVGVQANEGSIMSLFWCDEWHGIRWCRTACIVSHGRNCCYNNLNELYQWLRNSYCYIRQTSACGLSEGVVWELDNNGCLNFEQQYELTWTPYDLNWFIGWIRVFNHSFNHLFELFDRWFDCLNLFSNKSNQFGHSSINSLIDWRLIHWSIIWIDHLLVIVWRWLASLWLRRCSPAGAQWHQHNAHHILIHMLSIPSTCAHWHQQHHQH